MLTNEIQDVISCRTWDGPHGTMYFYKLRIGDKILEVGKKKPDAFTVGQELNYEIEEATNKTTGEVYLKLREVKEERPQWNGGGGGFQKRDNGDMNRSVSLSYAKDLEIALIADPVDGVNLDIDRILATADRFVAWLEQKSTETVPETTDNVTANEPKDWVDELKDERDASETQQAPKPVQTAATPQQTAREKPNSGSQGKPPSDKQLALLHKIGAEKNFDLDALAKSEWSDVESVDDLSSWAVSYCLDLLLGNSVK